MKGMKGQIFFQQDVGVTCLFEHDLFFNVGFLTFQLAVLPLFSPYTHNSVPKQPVQ